MSHVEYCEFYSFGCSKVISYACAFSSSRRLVNKTPILFSPTPSFPAPHVLSSHVGLIEIRNTA